MWMNYQDDTNASFNLNSRKHLIMFIILSILHIPESAGSAISVEGSQD